MTAKYRLLLLHLLTAVTLLVGIAGVLVPSPVHALAPQPTGTLIAECNPNSATAGCCATAKPHCIDRSQYCGKSDPLCVQGPQATACDKNSCDLVNNYLNKAINLASALVGLVVVLSLIMGAIQYSAAGGDPQKVTAARNRIRNTVIAFLAYILLYSFLQFLVPGGLFRK